MPNLGDHQSSGITGSKTRGRWGPKLDRIESRVVKQEGCWGWAGHIGKDGYPRIGKHLAHREYWRLTRGEIPQDKELCHTCDNPECINPDHLFIGSHKENMEDASAKGIMKGPRRLSDEDYETIRQMHEKGYFQSEIALFVGVTQSFVSQFLSGKYKHAKP